MDDANGRLDRLSDAEAGLPAFDRMKVESVFIGALAAMVDDETWDSCLATAVSWISRPEVD